MQGDAIALSNLESGMPGDLDKQLHGSSDHNNEIPRSRGITVLTVSIPSSETGYTQIDTNRPKPRWKTPEFILYGFLFITVVPYMVWIPYQLSQRMSHQC